jgi:hypothetical protein
MSTTMKRTRFETTSPPAKGRLGNEQLRRDRWTAVAVMAVTIVLMAFLVWLASIGGNVHEGFDHWSVMP